MIPYTNLHPSEYTQRLRYYPFAVFLDRCDGSCNNLNDLSQNYGFQTNRRFKSKRVQHDYMNN